MKLLLKNGPNKSLYFSNTGEGFNISVHSNILSSPTVPDQAIYLYFRSWDELAPFVTAVADYSHENGLSEVPTKGLSDMAKSFKDALDHIKEENAYRKYK